MGRTWEMGVRAAFIVTLGALQIASGAPGERFRTDGKRLLLDGQPFRIKGICYQPLLPGQDKLSPLDEGQVRRDMAMIARSGANTIRVYPQPLPGEGLPARLPGSFYDLARRFDLWIIRDIFVDVALEDYLEREALDSALASVHAVIDAVFAQGGQDRILAWEIGNEFSPHQVRCTNDPAYGCLEPDPSRPPKPTSFEGEHVSVTDLQPFEVFLATLADEIKAAVREKDPSSSTSTLVTWGSWLALDPLRSDVGSREVVRADFLDVVSYNVYSYWPERIRSFSPGSVTGTPYQGYLELLSSLYPEKPILVSEVGLTNSPHAHPESQAVLPPLGPAYRRGGLAHEQMAQGLEALLFDALLTEGVIGTSVFEWCDEWHKVPFSAWVHDDHPEEYFGLLSFDEGQEGLKPAFDAVRRVFSIGFAPPGGGPVISSVEPGSSSVEPGAETRVTVGASDPEGGPLEIRWFASCGVILGRGPEATYVAPPVALGPAAITVLVTDRLGRSATAQAGIDIVPDGPPTLSVDTCSRHRAGGRAWNVDLTAYRLVVFVKTDAYYLQPWADAPFAEVAKDGTWSTCVANRPDPEIPDDLRPGEVWAAFAPEDLDVPARVEELPPSIIAAASSPVNDRDGPEEGGDLLPDEWEIAAGLDPADPGDGTAGSHWSEGPLGDPDGDGLENLEEFRLGRNPLVADADADEDGLEDGWERRYLGSLRHGAGDDPDGDGITNAGEHAAGTSPGRFDHDTDGDGLPDEWEREHFGVLSQGADSDLDRDGLSNITEYRNLTDPRDRDTDGDGMTDDFEVLEGIQPLLGDAGEDPDGDAYTNAHEFRCWSDPQDPLSGGPPCRFIRGDANGDHRLALGDVLAMLRHIFAATDVFCRDAADVNDDGATTIADPVSFLYFLFRGAPPPEDPFPEPGPDPTDKDGLGCG